MIMTIMKMIMNGKYDKQQRGPGFVTGRCH